MTAVLASLCVADRGGQPPGRAPAPGHGRSRTPGSSSTSASRPGRCSGAAFFHMMPEAIERGIGRHSLNWSAAGLLALFFLERFFAFHHHEAPADPLEPCPTHPHEHAHGRGPFGRAWSTPRRPAGDLGATTKGTSLHWGAAAFGLALHTLTGGVALAGAVRSRSRALGPGALGVFIATLVHKPADALTIVSLMLRAGVPRGRAHLVNLGFSMMIPLGATCCSGWALGSWANSSADRVTANTLAFSAGTFLCIALSDLLARTPVPRPRPLEALGRAPGRGGPDGIGRPVRDSVDCRRHSPPDRVGITSQCRENRPNVLDSPSPSRTDDTQVRGGCRRFADGHASGRTSDVESRKGPYEFDATIDAPKSAERSRRCLARHPAGGRGRCPRVGRKSPPVAGPVGSHSIVGRSKVAVPGSPGADDRTRGCT